MTTKGTRVDALGRAVIPAPLRHELGMGSGVELDVQPYRDGVLMRPRSAVCVFCGNKATFSLKGKGICKRCDNEERVALGR